ncbi:conserved protein [Tepidicaulis marinus]|uniref:Conserved protein n=1 Tax=Tepidicaulis marinus TaxID=1333998 RepID=A0A081B6D8_9HYPH|nr:Mu-like prophage major head subunit gpT family protein [Tepidicaulis marinus]GAK43606.1 conserved protein [Tepidicaulis marinus]
MSGAVAVAGLSGALLVEAAFREAKGEVPALGIIGPEAVREAFEGDLTQLRDLLQGAVKKALELAGEEEWWPYVHALFDDFIVVEQKDGKLLKYPYEIDGTKVTLGTPQEVVKRFVPAEEGSAASMTEAASPLFIEARDEATYRIRIIKAGLSGNRNYYPDAVLREAVPLFEGTRVFVKSDAEHLSGGGKDVRNLIGALRNVTFTEGTGTDTGELQADLVLLEPEGDIAVKLREAWSRKLTELFGFSIDSRALAKTRKAGQVTVREAVKFTAVNSVDLIVEPGAGGAIINLIEAKGDPLMDREEIIALLEAKGLLKGKNTDRLSDEELTTMLREAVGTAAPAETATAGDTVTRDELRMIEARQTMREKVDASSLPDAAKKRVKTRFLEMASFREADVDEAIREEADYLATFTESGRVNGLGDTPRIEIGRSRFDKVNDMFDAFFDPSHKDHRHARSFKECYAAVTGDTRVTGRLSDADETLMREALDSASFSDVLGNAMNRRLIADYNSPTSYDIYKALTGSPVPINDFRTQERVRFGGYGDLPVVAESGDYTALDSPTDEKASYSVSKRGGIETITLEMIKNDDVGAIRQIPGKMGRAAKRTLSKFVLDFLRTNPVIYDGVTLFHASHNNLGAAALSSASLAAARLAMLKQQEAGSDEPLGIGPRYLWVPPELEEAAVDLFRRNTENDKTFQQSLSLEVMPVWYWTDVNDWVVTADPADIPIIELGFLDGNEEPELFVQDNPTVGSMFSSDKLTYKIRHIYGGTAKDSRGAYKSVVA